jgi:hypothetical protein
MAWVIQYDDGEYESNGPHGASGWPTKSIREARVFATKEEATDHGRHLDDHKVIEYTPPGVRFGYVSELGATWRDGVNIVYVREFADDVSGTCLEDVGLALVAEVHKLVDGGDFSAELAAVLSALNKADAAHADQAVDQLVSEYGPLSSALEVWRQCRDAMVCTGVAASWCPICGTCTCPIDRDQEPPVETCPLHGARSNHAV